MSEERKIKFLTTEEVAKIIGCCKRVARELIKKEIPHRRINTESGKNPGKIRVLEQDLYDWMKGGFVSR